MNSEIALEAKPVSNTYRYYVLAILALTYAFSFMDRQIVAILMGDLKAEFDLNDTQLGLLSGLAFALFYSVLAIPIARLADRSHRINIISIAVGVWSLVTAACAYVTNFTQLLLCRIGVGVGEAGGLSPAHSVISDYFNAEERSLAISLFSLGSAMGAFLGLAMGGYVAENYGWRMAFLVAGLPGLLLALAVKLTISEPVRGAMEIQSEQGLASADIDKPSFKETIASLLKNKIYLGTVSGHVLAVFKGYAITIWLPQMMLRNFDVSQTAVGTTVGLVFALGVTTGMIFGGYLATRLTRSKSPRWQLLVPVIGISCSIPFYFIALNADSFYLCAVLFGIGSFLFNWQHGPGLAVVQNYVRPDQRATAASFNFFFSNLLGLGLGPLVVGGISDAASSLGDQSLNLALGIVILAALPAAYIFYRTSKLLK